MCVCDFVHKHDPSVLCKNIYFNLFYFLNVTWWKISVLCFSFLFLFSYLFNFFQSTIQKYKRRREMKSNWNFFGWGDKMRCFSSLGSKFSMMQFLIFGKCLHAHKCIRVSNVSHLWWELHEWVYLAFMVLVILRH